MSFMEDAVKSGREYYLERADRDIEKNRKGDFKITVTQNGQPIDAEISYNLNQIDFEFGCNLFMLDQYDTPERQEQYLSQWKKLFNTAVVPLYWGGTEPEQGKLRYSKDSEYLYRRPPADRVVDYCIENGIEMKGHPLFWHEYIPKWVPQNWDELIPLVEKRFKEISERYAEKIPVFDCVNEPGRIFDMIYEHWSDGYKMLVPPDGYLEQIFELGKKYFPNNTLVLNEAVGSSLCEFKGIYGAFYQLLDRLIKEGLKIDRIGIQCHCYDNPVFKNIYDARRLYGVLDGYSKLNKPMVLSEIGLSHSDEEIQAAATEQLYKICFSIDNMSGIFWWNLDDDGILTTKQREGALGENLPYAGLCRQGREKAAYKVLDRLINHEWHTEGIATTQNGTCDFRGFYGIYDVSVKVENEAKTFTAAFLKNGETQVTLEW